MNTSRILGAMAVVAHDSNLSPLTQITPANVNQLTQVWTFNYGAGHRLLGSQLCVLPSRTPPRSSRAFRSRLWRTT